MHNRDMIWTTRDGREMPVHDMSNEHINNAIKYVNENYKVWCQHYTRKKVDYSLKTLKAELRYRKLNHLFNNPDTQEDLF